MIFLKQTDKKIILVAAVALGIFVRGYFIRRCAFQATPLDANEDLPEIGIDVGEDLFTSVNAQLAMKRQRVS